MMNILSNPFEATIAATSLMLSGALDEFPKLDVYLPHAGGFFAFVNPRIAFARSNMAGGGGGGGERWSRLKQPVERVPEALPLRPDPAQPETRRARSSTWSAWSASRAARIGRRR